ncbi:unnamed protein product [Nezara viridula]|uniref:RNA-directed DNA polymerase n=1 Tax=Nezara viridula TaxID=85310 RepID=A0A9P0HBH0_NEZVI|nr:unnamed protein product [Nezara viridula]
MWVADTLSRASVGKSKQEEEKEAFVIGLIKNMPISDKKCDIVRKETEKDEELKAVCEWIDEGCPKTKDPLLGRYESVKDELTFCDGIIFKGCQIVVLKSLRMDMLRKIHYAHQGMTKCCAKAKGLLYWPNMKNDIKNMVKHCEICQKYANSQCKEPMVLQEVAEGPWSCRA